MGKVFSKKLTKMNKHISIYRTTISDHYAVVDMGDNRAEAVNLVSFFKQAGNQAENRIQKNLPLEDHDRSNTRFLTGSFVQENRGWYVDPKCRFPE